MKRLSLTILVILLICLCGCNRQAKRIAKNDAEYLAAMDSLNMVQSELLEWNNREVANKYGHPRVQLRQELEEHPEMAEELQPILDSLNHCFDSLFAITNARLAEIGESRTRILKNFESISTEGFKAAFRKRHVYSSEQLDSIYNDAPRILKRSVAGKAIHEFLYGPKVWPGDKIIPFDCFDVNGNAFDWNTIKGKKTVIVADGLTCWTHGADDTVPVKYFDYLRTEYGNEFVWIVFFNNQDLDGLKEQVAHFGLEDYTVLADGSEFSSPLELMYDCQTLPSFVLIDPDGKLVRADYMQPDEIEAFLSIHSF